MHDPAGDGVQALALLSVIGEVPINVDRQPNIIIPALKSWIGMVDALFTFGMVVAGGIRHGGQDDLTTLEEAGHGWVLQVVREKILDQVVGNIGPDHFITVECAGDIDLRFAISWCTLQIGQRDDVNNAPIF